MNREQKIALIIGFAVILVVGVLVSDHWSRARQLELADASEGDAGLVEGPPLAMLPSPGGTRESPQIADAGHAQAPEEVPTREPEVVAIDQSSGGSDSPLGEALARTEAPESAPTSSWLDQFQKVGERVAQGIGAGLPAAAGLGEDQVGGTGHPTSPKPEPGPTLLEQAKPVRHTVAKNESLFAIAKRYYGDGNKWRRIAEANPQKVSKEGQVRQGVTLEIPGASDGRQARPAAPADEPRAKPRDSRPTTYTVQRNDSLSEISQRLLGSARRMGEILAANRGKISDPDDIRVGMVLTIPSSP